MLLLAITLGAYLLTPNVAFAEARYWVGGGSSANWNATGNTNWGTASGVQDNASVPTSADDAIFDGVGTGASNATVSANTSVKSINFTGYVNTFTLNNTVTVTVSGSVTMVAGMTFTPATVTTAFAFNANATLTTAGKLMPWITVLSGTTTLADNLTTMAGAGIPISIAGVATLDLNGKTVSGDSSPQNRLLIKGNALGTQGTIVMNGGTFAYADFQDIAFNNGGVDLDLSAITGLSGNAGNNSMTGGGTLTLPPSQTQYWVGDTGSWATAAEWGTTSGGSGGRVPLPQDDTVFDNNSFSGAGQTVTSNIGRAGRSMDWSAYNEGQTPTLGYSTSPTYYGSVTLNSGMTYNGAGTHVFSGRGAYTFTSAGKTIANVMSISMLGGTLTLQDAFNGTGALLINNGTLNSNGKNVTVTSFSSTGNSVRAIIMTGTETWTLTGTSGTVWNVTTGTNLTVTPAQSTIKITDTGNNALTFTGFGKTYNNLWFSRGASTGNNVINDSNTFNDLKDSGTAAHSLNFGAGTTQTVSTWHVSGSSGNIITINTDNGLTTTHALTKTGGGTIASDYLNIQHSVATPANTWYAGTHSTNNQSVATAGSGWIFTRPPLRHSFFGGFIRFLGGTIRFR